MWAHKNGQSFPEVDFQDGNDDDLSHSIGISSSEPHFCRPLAPLGPDQMSYDTGTCPTTRVNTDKGKLSPTVKTGYPPRDDLGPHTAVDSPDIDTYTMLNPFDGVSQATPEGDVPAELVWQTPATLPDGNYVLFVEVNKEFDQNDTYSVTKYPPPDVAYSEYGEPYRGQPSVVFRIPIAIGGTDATGSATDYAGYGDPDGLDGNLRVPDATISTTVPGSGALRLALTADGYRVKATSHVQFDSIAPAAVAALDATTLGGTTRISFRAPGDDGMTGQIAGYDIRLSPGEPIDATNFESIGTKIPSPANPVAPGEPQHLDLPNLLPDSDDYLGIEPLDDCHNRGPLETLDVPHWLGGGAYVDACFVATAAYGSIMVRDVGMLRSFRDQVLRRVGARRARRRELLHVLARRSRSSPASPSCCARPRAGSSRRSSRGYGRCEAHPAAAVARARRARRRDRRVPHGVDRSRADREAPDRRVARGYERQLRRHRVHHAGDRHVRAREPPRSVRLQHRPELAVRPAHHDVPGVVEQARHVVSGSGVPGRRGQQPVASRWASARSSRTSAGRCR